MAVEVNCTFFVISIIFRSSLYTLYSQDIRAYAGTTLSVKTGEISLIIAILIVVVDSYPNILL